ncbi:MAG: hypothetical protein GY863_13720 [bacterium]|nr:hypothetical protein [bacterium]
MGASVEKTKKTGFPPAPQNERGRLGTTLTTTLVVSTGDPRLRDEAEKSQYITLVFINSCVRFSIEILIIGDKMRTKNTIYAAKIIAGLLIILFIAGITACSTETISGPGEISIENSTDKIAFVSNREGNDDEIWLMNIDGSERVNLTDNDKRDLDPAWSPDGSKIAYASMLYDEDFEIHVIDRTTSNIVRLTNHPARDFSPAWSPDGTKIAFASRRTGQMKLWLMDSDGSDQEQLTFGDEEIYDYHPSWSPDGTKMVYQSKRPFTLLTTKHYIVIMDADGTNETVIAEGLNPTWSPDGSKIAYTGIVDGNYDIMVCNSDGSDEVRLTEWEDADLDPAWSPDGTKIAFARKIDGMREVYIMDPDGSNQVRITFRIPNTLGESNWFPRWSPLTVPENRIAK